MKKSIFFFVLLFLIATSSCEQSPTGDSNPSKPAATSKQSDSQAPQHRYAKEPVIDKAKIPDQPVSGQVMGRSFQPDGFEISEQRSLDFWVGDRMFPATKVSITLPLGFGESPAGQSFDFHTDEGGGFRPMIQISLKSDSGEPIFKSFRNHYRLKLSFGEAVEHSLPGRIYLRLPDKETKIAGVFHVAAPENPAQPPQKRHRPYVHGQIGFSPPEQRMLMACYAGMGDDGEVYHNGAGLKLTPSDAYSGGYVQSTTFKPRTTALWRDDEGSLHFRHVRLEPGNYILSMRWDDDLIAHQWQRVNKDATLNWDVVIDLAESGSLLVEVPGLKEGERVWLLPLNAYGVLPEGIDNRYLWKLPFHLQIKPEYKEDSAMFRLLPPGDYLVLYKDYRQKVKVISGKHVKIDFRY